MWLYDTSLQSSKDLKFRTGQLQFFFYCFSRIIISDAWVFSRVTDSNRWISRPTNTTLIVSWLWRLDATIRVLRMRVLLVQNWRRFPFQKCMGVLVSFSTRITECRFRESNTSKWHKTRMSECKWILVFLVFHN